MDAKCNLVQNHTKHRSSWSKIPKISTTITKKSATIEGNWNETHTKSAKENCQHYNSPHGEVELDEFLGLPAGGFWLWMDHVMSALCIINTSIKILYACLLCVLYMYYEYSSKSLRRTRSNNRNITVNAITFKYNNSIYICYTCIYSVFTYVICKMMQENVYIYMIM